MSGRYAQDWDLVADGPRDGDSHAKQVGVLIDQLRSLLSLYPLDVCYEALDRLDAMRQSMPGKTEKSTSEM